MAKKSTPITGIITVVSIIIVVYFGYRMFHASKVQAASTGGYPVGGVYGGGYDPAVVGAGQGTGSILGAIANALLGNKQQQSKSGGGSGGGSGSGGSTAARAGSSGGVNPLQTLADFVGAGYADYFNGGAQDAYAQTDAGTWAGSGYQIGGTDYNPQTLDVSQFASDYNAYGTDYGWTQALDEAFAQTDAGAWGDYQIPYEDAAYSTPSIYSFSDLGFSDYSG